MRTSIIMLALMGSVNVFAQTTPTEPNQNQQLDIEYIDEVEQKKPFKNLHAEPLYIDLIRDLGARKGEREWNIAGGLTDQQDFDKYELLAEYEWAPINRLGLEVEVPLTFYTPNAQSDNIKPSHRVEGLKTAIQWSFLVHEKTKLSMALGYLNEIQFTDLNSIAFRNLFKGNSFNPFLVMAKRWGNNFHSLIYTGPIIEQEFGHKGLQNVFAINTSFHYMIKGTRNFIGVEFNKEIEQNDFDMVIRPQMRVAIAENIIVGIVGGIPISKKNERLSTFLRLIYEPSHQRKKRGDKNH